MAGDQAADPLARELLRLRRKIADGMGYHAQTREGEPAADFYDRANAEMAAAKHEERPRAVRDRHEAEEVAGTAARPRPRPLFGAAALIGVVVAIGSGAWFGASARGVTDPDSLDAAPEGVVSQAPASKDSINAELAILEARIESASKESVPDLVARRDSLRAVLREVQNRVDPVR